MAPGGNSFEGTADAGKVRPSRRTVTRTWKAAGNDVVLVETGVWRKLSLTSYFRERESVPKNARGARVREALCERSWS